MKENIDYVKSLNQVREIFYDEQPLDSIEELKKVDDRFKSITKKEIDTIAKDFQFKNIIKYLTQHIPNTNGNGFLSEIIPAYSELSSYVH